jgi:hypothetical protein
MVLVAPTTPNAALEAARPRNLNKVTVLVRRGSPTLPNRIETISAKTYQISDTGNY